MSSLTALEKRALEKLLRMSGGYVLNFTDRTFAEFILDVVKKDIRDAKYHYASASKANRLRAFWSVEPDHVVATLLSEMVELSRIEAKPDPELLAQAERIVQRLRLSAPVADLDALTPNADAREFDALARAVRDAIEANEPEVGLDRLHAFVMRFIRVLAEKEGIETPIKKPLHSVFGELVKALKARGAVESEMGERILKATISILDAFNHVRNNRSLAHDNPLLSYPEALLIFNHVASAIRFLSEVVGAKPEIPAEPGNDDDWSS